MTATTGTYNITATPHSKRQWDYWRQFTDCAQDDGRTDEREDEEEAA